MNEKNIIGHLINLSMDETMNDKMVTNVQNQSVTEGKYLQM